MIPLRVDCVVGGAVSMPNAPLALDGLLAWAVAARDEMPQMFDRSSPPPIEIPVAREPRGRFHLASFAEYEVEQPEPRWVNRKFPIAEAQAIGNAKLRRVDVSAGPQKIYRLPLETVHLVGDRLTWWCVGDAEAIRDLLALVLYVGKKRSVGIGRVEGWRVEPCESWGDGFPVVRDGRPLRALPLDWPGVTDGDVARRVLTYPYWMHERETECFVP